MRKKCNFEKLLEETNEKYYWLGFLLADGSFGKKKELKIGLSNKDKEHLIKLQNFLNIENMQTNDKTNSVYISGKDSKIFDEITKKYKAFYIKAFDTAMKNL